jgi:hypothetical protein
MRGDDRPCRPDAGDDGPDDDLERATLQRRRENKAATREATDHCTAPDGATENAFLQRDRRRYRHQDRELSALALDLLTEIATAGALA